MARKTAIPADMPWEVRWFVECVKSEPSFGAGFERTQANHSFFRDPQVGQMGSWEVIGGDGQGQSKGRIKQ